MTNLELVLNMLAEATTNEISKEKNPKTFNEKNPGNFSCSQLRALAYGSEITVNFKTASLLKISLTFSSSGKTVS